MATLREERLANNEALFRLANERMAEWEERQGPDADADFYLCECADVDCREKVRLRTAEYEAVRSDPRHFLVVTGHDVAEVETVIERHGSWSKVEKNPDLVGILEATDPRTD
ncbi:MAG: hypothetical protein H0U42_09250 [Thermoleophilaceae bacterium]|nr:hypothetical protein [Thermoleophilaceae bacterium]